jgi:hypothetical protein
MSVIPIHTLVGLACLIANNGVSDLGSIESQLTAAEVQQVSQVIQSGACLPDNLERLLEETKVSGQDKLMSRMAPSDSCFR